MEEEMEKIKDELENIKEELRELKGELRIMDRSIDQILEDATKSFRHTQAIKEIQSTIQKIGREENWATDVWFIHTLTRPQLML